MQTAVSVSSVSGFSGFLVNRNRFGFGDSSSVSSVLVQLAAFLTICEASPSPVLEDFDTIDRWLVA